MGSALDSSSIFLEFLKSRRSIRRFKPQEVPLEVISSILDVARYAPSAGNKQPWIFIVVLNKEVRSMLAKIHTWAFPLEDAPVNIVVACSKDVSPHSFQVDCANAAMYIMLAAHALGLGTVWIQSLRNISEIQKIVKLPENYIPVAIIALGYPDESPGPRPRKALSEVMCIEEFCKSK